MQRYMCFGCHETGDCFTFLEKYDNMTFSEGLKYLAGKAGIVLKDFIPSKEDRRRERAIAALSLAREYYHFLLMEHPAGEKAREYLKERGTTNDTIKLFGLGVSLPGWDGLQRYLIGKKGFTYDELLDAGLIIRSERGTYYDRFRERLMFPLTNVRGIVVGFSGRTLNPTEKTAKYINSPETMIYHKSELLFGFSQLHRFVREKEEVVLVEGEFDVLSSFQAHVNNVCAIKGSALSQEQLKLLSRSVRRIIFALDSDKAGQDATRRAIGLARDFDISLRVIILTGGKDPDDIARENPKTWREMVKSSVTVYDYLIDQAFERYSTSSGDGKREITNELGPLIMGITNGVEQAHYLQKIAKRLEVGEEVLMAEFRRKSMPIASQETEKQEEKRTVKTREDLLEDYLFSLQFHLEGQKFVSHFERTKALIQSRTLRKIMESLEVNANFDLSRFSQSLPEELKSLLFQTYMSGEAQLGSGDLETEYAFVVKELDSLRKKTERESLAARLTELEQKEVLTKEEEEQVQNLLRQIR